MIFSQTSQDGRFKMEMPCEFVGQEAPHAYKRNHNYIVFTDLTSGSGLATITLGGATYVFGRDKRAVFDTTDYIRSLYNGDTATFCTFAKGGQTSTMVFNYIINEGADPYLLARSFPKDSYLCDMDDYKRIGYHLPNIIYSAPAFGGMQRFICDIDGSIGGMDGGTVQGEFVLRANTTVVGGADYPQYIPVKPLVGTAALVRWDALAGWNAEQGFATSQPYKQAVWEVVSQKMTTAAEEYTTHGDGYRAHKTPSLALTLKIGGLDAYSYQYYSDIIAANDVRLILSPDEDILGDEARVEVQTKDVKTQMSGALEWYDLVIDVAYKGF